MAHAARRCPGPLTRRGFLGLGAAAVGGLSLADVMRLRAEASSTDGAALDTALIFVWLPGGPPHLETYDMKPGGAGGDSRRFQSHPHGGAGHRSLRTVAPARSGGRPLHPDSFDRPHVC